MMACPFCVDVADDEDICEWVVFGQYLMAEGLVHKDELMSSQENSNTESSMVTNDQICKHLYHSSCAL